MSTALILLSEFRKTEIELWCSVPNWAMYDVSSLGRIRSRKKDALGRILKFSSSRDGYSQIVFQHCGKKKLMLVHRLVAQSFLKNISGLLEVNHKTFIKADCRRDNLEWITRAGNVQHAAKYGAPTVVRGEKHGLSKLANQDVIKIRALKRRGANSKRIAVKFGVSKSLINQIVSRAIWTHL